jgi:hypothetical protein
VSLKWTVGLAIACSAMSAARAEERTVFVDVPAGAPFDASELAAAIQLRMASGGKAIRVRVLAISGGVRIEARGNARDVVLGGLIGPAAARLVALAANDLLLDDLAAVPAGSVVVVHDPTSPTSTTVGALGSAAMWSHMVGGLGIDVAMRSGRRVLAIEAGGGTLVNGPLQLLTAVARIGGGVRFDTLELRATATIAPLLVESGGGDRTLLLGAGASARMRVPITAAVRAVFAGGIDVFVNRTSYVVDGMSVLATPRGAPWLAAGLEVAP